VRAPRCERDRAARSADVAYAVRAVGMAGVTMSRFLKDHAPSVTGDEMEAAIFAQGAELPTRSAASSSTGPRADRRAAVRAGVLFHNSQERRYGVRSLADPKNVLAEAARHVRRYLYQEARAGTSRRAAAMRCAAVHERRRGLAAEAAALAAERAADSQQRRYAHLEEMQVRGLAAARGTTRADVAGTHATAPVLRRPRRHAARVHGRRSRCVRPAPPLAPGRNGAR
jgi:hypothetical protein